MAVEWLCSMKVHSLKDKFMLTSLRGGSLALVRKIFLTVRLLQQTPRKHDDTPPDNTHNDGASTRKAYAVVTSSYVLFKWYRTWNTPSY